MGIRDEVAIFPPKNQRYVSVKDELATARAAAQRNLSHVAEHQPMTAEQRRALVMALGVLAILDNI